MFKEKMFKEKKRHKVTCAIGYGKTWIQNLSSYQEWEKENEEIVNGWDAAEYRRNRECIENGNYAGIAIDKTLTVMLVDREAPDSLVDYLRGRGLAVIMPPEKKGDDFLGIEEAIAINQAFWTPDSRFSDFCRYCGAKFNKEERNGWDCPECGCN